MKRISAIFLCLLIGTAAFPQHKVEIGTDLGRMLKKGVLNISAGYGFSDRWSLSWTADICTRLPKKEDSIEHEMHMAEFEVMNDKRSGICSSMMAVRYWPAGTYEGVWMEAGCRCTEGTGADCCIGVGYSIPIWRGLTAGLSYGADILASLRESKPSGNGLTIGIFWIIKGH